MATLNLYEDENGNEFIAIITSHEFENEMKEVGIKLVDKIALTINDFTSWPTDRLMSQE